MYLRRVWAVSLAGETLPAAEALARTLDATEHLAGLSTADRSMLRFVARLTLLGASMKKTEPATLTMAGFDDVGIHDVVCVTSMFAFMNRLAGGLGVMLAPSLHGLARELFGAEALREHLAWGASAPEVLV